MSNDKTEKDRHLSILIGAISVVVILWGISFCVANNSILEDAAQFGDSFGAINALFSGLAFAFLIYTVWMQRQDLSLQQDQLKLQLDEMREQREEMKAQRKIQILQAELQRAQLATTISSIYTSGYEAEIQAFSILSSAGIDPANEPLIKHNIQGKNSIKITEISQNIKSNASLLRKQTAHLTGFIPAAQAGESDMQCGNPNAVCGQEETLYSNTSPDIP